MSAPRLRRSCSLLLLGLSLVPAAQAQEVLSVPGRAYVARRSRAQAVAQAASRRVDPLGPMARTVQLPQFRGPVPRARVDPKARLQVGFHRSLTGPGSGVIDGTDLRWEPAWRGGWVTTVRVVSPGAAALRTEIRFLAFTPGTQLRFYPDGKPGRSVGPFRDRDLDPGTAAPGHRAEPFWSPVIDGDSLVLEIWAPRMPRPGELAFALQQVSHLTVHPLVARDLDQLGNSGACERDVACDKKWLEASKAVAKIIFESGGFGFLCTGQLVAQTGKKRQKPFFLTAAHCIGTKPEAKSATFFWFFRRAECQGADPTSVTQTGGGARLLFTTKAEGGTSTTDHTLLKLRRRPPDGTNLAGWTLLGPDDLLNRPVQGLHHPAGDVLKSSRGKIDNEGKIIWGDGGSFTIQFAQPATHHEVVWNKGVTEGGSSGSGLYRGNRWPRQYLVGLLTGGLSFCGAPNDPDFYGRFDRTFQDNARVRKFLDPGNTIAPGQQR